MFKALSAFILTVFCLWLLPLGIFIESAREGTLCGGKRAVCECSSQFKARTQKASIQITSAAAVPSAQSESSGGEHPVLPVAVLQLVEKQAASHFFDVLLEFESFIRVPLEAPPELA